LLISRVRAISAKLDPLPHETGDLGPRFSSSSASLHERMFAD
jgi:hypothetical protein